MAFLREGAIERGDGPNERRRLKSLKGSGPGQCSTGELI